MKFGFKCHGIKNAIVVCIFIYFTSLPEVYTTLWDDIRSPFVYVQYKQEKVVAMQLHIQIFGGRLSATLTENARKSPRIQVLLTGESCDALRMCFD